MSVPEGEGRTKGEGRGDSSGGGGLEGRKEVVQVNFIPSHLFSLLPTLSP